MQNRGDAVRKSVLECEIVCSSMEKVQKVRKTIGDGFWLVVIIKKYCINKYIYILFGFDYFDIDISIYFWHRSLILVIGTASIMLMDGAKQAKLVVVIGQSRIQ